MDHNFSPEAARAWLPFLQEQALTEPEFWLLRELDMTVPMSAERLIRWTWQEGEKTGAKQKSDLELALQSLIDRRLVLEIDESVLTAIKLLSLRSRLFPLSSFPAVGDIDLSLSGAAVMKRWECLVFGPVPKGRAVRSLQNAPPFSVFGTDKEAVSDFIECPDLSEDGTVQVGEITPCGPWSDRWWSTYSCGFVCQVTTRESS